MEKAEEYIKLGATIFTVLYFFGIITFLYSKFGNIEPDGQEQKIKKTY